MPSSGHRKVLNAASTRLGPGDPHDEHRQTRKDPGEQCEQTAHLILQQSCPGRPPPCQESRQYCGRYGIDGTWRALANWLAAGRHLTAPSAGHRPSQWRRPTCVLGCVRLWGRRGCASGHPPKRVNCGHRGADP